MFTVFISCVVCVCSGTLSRPAEKREHSGEQRGQSSGVSEDNHEACDRFVSEVHGKTFHMISD